MIKIGVSTRLDWKGKSHPYLVVLKDEDTYVQSVISLPRSEKYLNPPVHPLYGDLMKGPTTEEVKVAIQKVVGKNKAATVSINKDMNILADLDLEIIEHDEISENEEAFSQIDALNKHYSEMETA